MSSILNSISSGELRVHTVSEANSANNESVMDIFQNSEIEFRTCPTFKSNTTNFNTGFGENGDLHYNIPCKKHKLNTPLYKENYLQEFQTEEEKAAARHALGLYNKGDVVAKSLLTTVSTLPTVSELSKISVQTMRKGDVPFVPITLVTAVMDSSGVTLDKKLKDIHSTLQTQKKELDNISKISNSKTVSSLGDVKMFLQGFNNGDNLKNILTDMDQEMLRFETTGQI